MHDQGLNTKIVAVMIPHLNSQSLLTYQNSFIYLNLWEEGVLSVTGIAKKSCLFSGAV